ncbi:MAG: metal ABC transporter substrate-binding protein [Planctomycetota bacterium]
MACYRDVDRGTTEHTAQNDGPLRVAVVNHPLEYFTERIGGDLVDVVFPAPPDIDPAFWSPGPDSVAAYQQADVIFRHGAGYARWIDRTTLPASRLVDTSAAFADRLIGVEDAVVHTHGPAGEHRAILEALVEARPQHETSFRGGFDTLERDLLEIDRQLETAFSGQPLLASHPVYQYLAGRYSLSMRSVHFEPDERPDERAWGDLEKILAEHPASLMLWEGEPLPDTAARLETLGVGVVVFDPCGNRPGEGDWMTTMRRNAERVLDARGAHEGM